MNIMCNKQKVYKISGVRIPHREDTAFTVIWTNQLMMSRETFAVYTENDIKIIHALWEKLQHLIMLIRII